MRSSPGRSSRSWPQGAPAAGRVPPVFGALREGLVQHMAFEEEALFPLLEDHAAAAVRSLRDDHAQLRRRLETLGAAEPERDPAGCLAELDDLSHLMRLHHDAEMALVEYAAGRCRSSRSVRPPWICAGCSRPSRSCAFPALERSPGRAAARHPAARAGAAVRPAARSRLFVRRLAAPRQRQLQVLIERAQD